MRRGRPPIYGDRITWSIMLPTDLVRRAEAYREREGVSQSALVEAALVKLLAAKAKAKPAKRAKGN